MRMALLTALLLSAGLLFAQTDQSTGTHSRQSQKQGQVTVRGCISKEGGDFILMKENPGMSYQLQSTGKIKLSSYLGQRVELTGKQSPTLSTSEDSLNRTGNASPVTITVDSITTIDKECRNR